MTFINKALPPNYKVIKEEKPYLKITKIPADKDYKLRMVQPLIAGWIQWKDKKPYRYTQENKPLRSFDSAAPLQQFWTMYVWDYQQEGLYILEITQKGLRIPFEKIATNPDFGDDICSFDFIITRTVKGKTPEGHDINGYTIMPLVPKPLPQSIREALIDSPVRLEALFENGDPWTDLEPTFIQSGLNDAQSAQLDTLLQKINDRNFQQQLEANFKVASLHNIPESEFHRAIRALEDKINTKKENKNDQRRMATVA
jgi:hypothetical protein